MTTNRYPQIQIDAVRELIELMAPDADVARPFLDSFNKSVESADPKTQSGLLWLLKDITDWKLSYFADWKDGDSFVDAMWAISEIWNARVRFGVENPDDEDYLDAFDITEMMMKAYEELSLHGLTLWNWDTGADCYSGWITKSQDTDKVLKISKILGVEIRPANNPF